MRTILSVFLIIAQPAQFTLLTHTQSQFTLINSKWAGITIVLSRLLRHSKSFTLQSTLTHLHTQSYTVCDTERYMGEVWSSQ